MDEDDFETEFFHYGDFVRLVQNHDIKGQVINELGWGDRYFVRLKSNFAEVWFDSIELEHDPDFHPRIAYIRGGSDDGNDPDGGEELPVLKTGTDNVVPFPKGGRRVH